VQPESILAKVNPVAAASRDATSAVLQVAPPLGEVTLDQARELISAANTAGATIEPGSYCALAQSAAGLNKRYGTAASAAAGSAGASGQGRVRLAHNPVTPPGVYISPNQAKQMMHEAAHELQALKEGSAGGEQQAPAFTVATTTTAGGQL
jgi:hypothetical protein